MPGRFKDYIAVPKPNMYQSIHTTLLGEKGVPFEVQIRTWDMHKIAENGIAAHWAYKEANFLGRGKKNVVVTDDKLSWLRETLEWQQEMQDPEQFLDNLKRELFEDEVYVFTPKGLIKSLPKGATPIDFAYSVHAEIGNHMVGCKINSKMMPIITPLKSGDIIEILTSDNSKGPSMDWLKFVKSTSARTKINSWFKKEKRVENIEKGKELIEKEIKRLGIPHEKLFKTDYINAMLNRYKYKDLDEMYAAVGFGANSATKVIARMLIEYRKDNKEEDLEEKIEELSKAKEINKTKPSSNGIVVKGIDNCLVKLSKCCNPLPGDEIIGYITKGRGVSVHRKDCVNVKDLIKEENRIIDVVWEEEKKATYNVDIEVYANDRSGLLSDVVKELNSTKVNIIGVNAKTGKDRIAIIDLTLRTKNLDELNSILRSIRKIDSVYEVKRKKI
jgi:GTP pyrophosphokinase